MIRELPPDNRMRLLWRVLAGFAAIGVIVAMVVLSEGRRAPPPTSRAPTRAFPNATSTGVPLGVKLQRYSGPMTITTPGTAIDAKSVDGTLTIHAKNVTITRSRVQGNVAVSWEGSVAISDSVVDGGKADDAAVGQYNVTLRRVEVVGARQSVSCHSNCDIEDSWLHGQYMQPGSAWHGDGYISNGGSNVLLRHNTLACDSKPDSSGGACSAAVAAYGDWAPITHHTYDDNLFVASPAGYCLYAGWDPNKSYGANPTYVVVTNNVFERGSSGKCAVYGPYTAFKGSGRGNLFSGNVWDDGTPLNAK